MSQFKYFYSAGTEVFLLHVSNENNPSRMHCTHSFWCLLSSDRYMQDLLHVCTWLLMHVCVCIYMKRVDPDGTKSSQPISQHRRDADLSAQTLRPRDEGAEGGRGGMQVGVWERCWYRCKENNWNSFKSSNNQTCFQAAAEFLPLFTCVFKHLAVLLGCISFDPDVLH